MLMVTKVMPQTHINCKADPKSLMQHIYICDKTKHATCDIRLSVVDIMLAVRRLSWQMMMINIDRGNNDDYVYDEDDQDD